MIDIFFFVDQRAIHILQLLSNEDVTLEELLQNISKLPNSSSF
jgi:hypothetical protein